MGGACVAVAVSLCVTSSAMASEVDAGAADADRAAPTPSAYRQVLDLQRLERTAAALAAPAAPLAAFALSAAETSLRLDAADGWPGGESCPNVPLPGTLPLLAVGLAGLVGWARRPWR